MDNGEGAKGQLVDKRYKLNRYQIGLAVGKTYVVNGVASFSRFDQDTSGPTSSEVNASASHK